MQSHQSPGTQARIDMIQYPTRTGTKPFANDNLRTAPDNVSALDGNPRAIHTRNPPTLYKDRRAIERVYLARGSNRKARPWAPEDYTIDKAAAVNSHNLEVAPLRERTSTAVRRAHFVAARTQPFPRRNRAPYLVKISKVTAEAARTKPEAMLKLGSGAR